MKNIFQFLALFVLIAACSRDNSIEDETFQVVNARTEVSDNNDLVAKSKKWFDEQMRNKSNVITNNNIVWNWNDVIYESSEILHVQSSSSSAENSTYTLKVINDDGTLSGNVIVQTHFKDYIREAILELDGTIKSVKNQNEIMSKNDSEWTQSLLLSMNSNSGESGGGGSSGGTWVWDSSIGAWTLPGVTVVFEQTSLNNSSASNNIVWSNVNSYVGQSSASFYNNTYSYPAGSSSPYPVLVSAANNGFDPVAVMGDIGPDHPISDKDKLFDCININSSATVTLYANQPVKNSSTPIAWNTDVGHSFISIKQGGTTIVFGFYPDGSGNGGILAPSALGDNGGDYFDVSVSKNVSSTVLASVIALARNVPAIYDINNYNCTDYARAIANEAGINVANAYGLYPPLSSPIFAGGENPGKLGQNIRTMPLDGVTKNTTGGNAPSTNSNCL